MAKRKLDEAFELAKAVSDNERVEGSSAPGLGKLQTLLSISKPAQDEDNIQVRTTAQLYKAFKYFLTQRSWGIDTPDEEQKLWISTMHILNMPPRVQIRFLERALFLEAFENAILTAQHFRFLRKGEDVKYPHELDGYNREHPMYQEVLVSYEEYLKSEDEEFDGEVEDWNVNFQEHFFSIAWGGRRASDSPEDWEDAYVGRPAGGGVQLVRAPYF